MGHLAKIFISISEGVINSFERHNYESVEEKSLS